MKKEIFLNLIILKILLENIELLHTGLCDLSFQLFISKKVDESEMKALKKYINDNNPYGEGEYMFIQIGVVTLHTKVSVLKWKN